MPQRKLATIAKTYCGSKETDDNRAGNDPNMQQIFEADDLWIQGRTDGYPWCAAFISLCVQKLCQQSTHYHHLTPPRLASVSRFYIWAKKHNCLIFKSDNGIPTLTPVVGDIVIFTFSHIGIITAYDNGVITTIEGNTSESGSREGTRVAQKKRCPSIIRDFIRLPLKKTHEIT